MSMGMILNVQHFCLDDGPGVRTTVFLKGCPLHCVWCHNPESQRAAAELLFDPSVCIGCGACEAACTTGALSMRNGRNYQEHTCKSCGACAEACPSNALEPAGKTVTAKAVMEKHLNRYKFDEEAIRETYPQFFAPAL